MSQSAENTPVSNQTPAVRKSLYSNAGNFIYHSVKLHEIVLTYIGVVIVTILRL